MKSMSSLDSFFSLRKLAFQVPLLALLIMALMAVSSGSASALVTNGSFETGDLTGWTTQGNVEALTAENFDPSIPVPDGEFYALISNGGDPQIPDEAAEALIDELDLLIDDLFDIGDEIFFILDDIDVIEDLEAELEGVLDDLEDFIVAVDGLADDVGGDLGDQLDAIAEDKEDLLDDLEVAETEDDLLDALDVLSANIDALIEIIIGLENVGSTAPDNTPFPDTDGDGQPDNDLTFLSQTFSGHGNLCFDWAWLTDEEAEGPEFDDIFYVLVNGEVVLSGSVDKEPEQSPFPNVPTDDEAYEVFSDGPTDGSFFDSGRSEFAEFCTYVGGVATDEYTVHFVVADQGNHEVDSGLLIDNVRVETPEPKEPVVVNDLVTLNAVSTSFNLPAGVFTLKAAFVNTSGETITAPFFEVAILEGPGCPCKVIGFGGVGAQIPIDAGADGVLEPGEGFEHSFDIKLSNPAPLTFFANVLGVVP